jgi:tRNA A-37 threonylcarbamoyl transferase component Bud32
MDREDHLDEVIAAFEQAEMASPQDREEWLRRYPEVAAELGQYFEDQGWIRAMVPDRGAGEIESLGRYRILEEIGRGGMGIVYKAHQPDLDRIVAVKIMRDGTLATAEDVRRFRREARLAARLNHPNIVTTYEVGEQDGLAYFAMEYVDGEGLDKRILRGVMEPEDAARYAQQIAEGVQHAHHNDVLHRDLKPSNILIDAAGRPKIGDFGLARSISGYATSSQILGTLNYMSPEQAEGRTEEVGPASDVYSMGAVLYECLTGRAPCRGHTPQETYARVLNAKPLPPRTYSASVPADLEAVCLKCLEKEPGRRYASAKDLAEDLGRFREGKPVTAHTAGAWERMLRLSGSGIGLVAGPLLALLIGMGPWLGMGLDAGHPEYNTMAAVFALMAVWWMTEAIPAAATAFLPLLLLPMGGIAPLKEVSAAYMHDTVLMTLGGFLIIVAVEESGLVRRLALRIVGWTGDSAKRIVLGFMIATGVVSMWVSNAAAVLIMLPVALSVLSEAEEARSASAPMKKLGSALMLGLAYASTIGGLSTPIGTLATVDLMSMYGGKLEMTGLTWMAMGMPYALAMGLVGWKLLDRQFELGSEALMGGGSGIAERRNALGRMKPASGA